MLDKLCTRGQEKPYSSTCTGRHGSPSLRWERRGPEELLVVGSLRERQVSPRLPQVVEVVDGRLEILGHDVGPEVALVEGQDEERVPEPEAEEDALGGVGLDVAGLLHTLQEKKCEGVVRREIFVYPTNIGIVRGTVSVATIVEVSAGVDI